MKHKIDTEESASPSKKLKKTPSFKKPANNEENATSKLKKFKDKPNFNKSGKKAGPTFTPNVKAKKFQQNGKGKFNNSNQNKSQEKVEDWSEFKKKKKELKMKRKQEKPAFDVIVQAKKIGEKLRRKTLKGGEEERNKLINDLHNLLKDKGHYAKFVLAHDTARLVQWLLKYSSEFIKNQISKEILTATVDMLQSKYGVHCVKRLLKYGNTDIRSSVIKQMYGHAVKLTSHSVSAPVVEYAFTTWATPLQKQHLITEFFGDLYKKSKDDKVKHLRDIYKDDTTLKSATLGATKANLLRILNKTLLDSGLVQSVICQFLSECSIEDRTEIISQLAAHIVVISNSKDGARAAMQCIWHGSNKDRKIIMKTLKEHLVELSQHEHGHCTIITLLDTADDTVLLHKIILSELLKNAQALAVNEWGRKVLLWLVAPADSTRFHPVFIKELEAGRESSTCKKSPEIRRKEILNYASDTLLGLVSNDPKFWLSNASLAVEMLAIVKAGSGKELEKAYKSIVETITNTVWKVKENDKEIDGIEHAGMHMALKKLAQNDKTILEQENNTCTFGSILSQEITDQLLQAWLKCNRGCFLLVTVFENGSEETKSELKKKLKSHKKLLKSQKNKGASILLKHISS